MSTMVTLLLLLLKPDILGQMFIKGIFVAKLIAESVVPMGTLLS